MKSGHVPCSPLDLFPGEMTGLRRHKDTQSYYFSRQNLCCLNIRLSQNYALSSFQIALEECIILIVRMPELAGKEVA